MFLLIISHFKMISRVMCCYIFSSQNVSQLHVFVFLNFQFTSMPEILKRTSPTILHPQPFLFSHYYAFCISCFDDMHSTVCFSIICFAANVKN